MPVSTLKVIDIIREYYLIGNIDEDERRYLETTWKEKLTLKQFREYIILPYSIGVEALVYWSKTYRELLSSL